MSNLPSQCQTLNLKLSERGVLNVTLNRPELHNAFNEVMIAELTEVFGAMQQLPALRAVILNGNGKSFCAGADLNWMKKMAAYTREENFADAQALARMLEAIDLCPVPVIALAQGAALGGGVGLLSCCDYVVAEEKLQWGLTEVRLGLLPAVISPFVLNKIGVSWARALFVSGQRLSAARGIELGLIHETVAAASELEAAGQRYVDMLLQNGPRAVREAKALIRGVLARQGRPGELRDYTATLISTLRTGAEGQEGMSALLEKRAVVWPSLS